MPNIDHLIQVCEEQREAVYNLQSMPIQEAALDVAYYYAMLDAASDDPLDDEEEQTAFISYLLARLKETLEHYQSLVNEHL